MDSTTINAIIQALMPYSIRRKLLDAAWRSLAFFRLFIVWGAVCIAAIMPGFSSYAATAFTVNAQMKKDLTRITFSASDISFSTSLSGNVLNVNFNQQVSPNFAGVNTGFIKAHSLSANRRTLSFTLQGGEFRARKFMSDNSMGIDIIPLNAAAMKPQPSAAPNAAAVKAVEARRAAAGFPITIHKAPATAAPERPQPKAAEKAKKPVKEPKQKPAAPTKQVEKRKPAKPVKLKEKSKEKPKDVTVRAVKTPPVHIKPVPEIPVKAPVATPEAPKIVQPAPKPAEQPVTAPVTAPAPIPAQMPQIPAQVVPLTGQGMGVQKAAGGVVWQFRWKQDVAAAIFARGKALWLVFNTSDALDTMPLLAYYGNTITISRLPGNHYTILRVTGVPSGNMTVTKKGTGEWDLFIADAAKPELKPKTLLREYLSPASKGAFYPAEGMEQPLTVTDPEVMDQLSIVPFYSGSVGVAAPGQKTVDYQLLPSAQGMAVALIADEVSVEAIPTGVEIISPTFTLSRRGKNGVPETPGFKEERQEVPARTESLAPMGQQEEGNDAKFLETEHKLLEESSRALPGEKSEARYQLARFYVQQNLAAEALAMIKLIKSGDMAFANTNKVRLLEGISQFMMQHYPEGKQALDGIAQDQYSDSEKKEVQLWQAATDSQLKLEDGKPIDFLGNRNGFLRNYDPEIRNKFALMAIEQAFDRKQPQLAGKIIAALEKEPDLSPEAKNALAVHKGQLAALAGKTDEAFALWDPVAKQTDDRFNRARAELNKIKLQLDTGALKLPEAIKKIDALRIAWRGDGFEQALLKELGSLNIRNHNYADGLRAWRQAVNYFPNSGQTLLLSADMSKLFVSLFTEDALKKQLNDLQAVSLYYEFRDLTPIGRAGDMVIQQLAERMVKLDLLDRASALLNHQIRYRMQGEERAALANKLANIHLINHKPKQALEILELTDKDATNPDKRLERQHLKVKAYMDMEKYNEALALLTSDASQEATNLRLYMFWKNKDWPKVRNLLEPRFLKLMREQTPLNAAESREALSLGIAYVMMEDNNAVQQLYKSLAPRLVEDKKLRDTFRFIAMRQGPIDYQNLEASTGIGTIAGFMEDYRKGLYSAPPPPAKVPAAAPAPAAPAAGTTGAAGTGSASESAPAPTAPNVPASGTSSAATPPASEATPAVPAAVGEKAPAEETTGTAAPSASPAATPPANSPTGTSMEAPKGPQQQ